MTLIVRPNGAIEPVDPSPWRWETYRRRKASIPSQLRPVECGVFSHSVTFTDADNDLFVREVAALDRWFVVRHPEVFGRQRFEAIAARLDVSFEAIRDALEEATATELMLAESS